MDIRYIRKNMQKQSVNDMMNVLKDLVIKSDIATINNFSELKQYHAGEKVYIKEGNIHRVYVCKVANSTVGEIKPNEWYQYIEGDSQSGNNINPIDIYEETTTVEKKGYLDYPLNYSNYNSNNTKIAVFNSVQPRLRYGIDFTVTSNGVVKFLKSLNAGERLIFEIRKLNGRVFNNLFREVYVEETYTPVRKTKIVPITYHGYRESSKLQIFNKDGKLLTKGIDYTLNRNKIIMKNWVNAKENVHITMWNKVMIKSTSHDYIIDEDGTVYKLGVNDMAQLLLTECGDVAIGNPYIELVSDDGRLFHCTPTRDKQLKLTQVEPDVILSSDEKKYKISIDSTGKLYLKEVDIDFHKDIYIVSLDTQLYQLVSNNGELDINKVVNNTILIQSLSYKHIISDDSRLYNLTIENGVLKSTEIKPDYNKEKPTKYLNLISESGINFLFFATNDGHLAVRPIYLVDDTSNIVLGDDGGLYLIGMTNEGEIFTQEVRSAPYVAEHKQITDAEMNLYEIHIDEGKHLYLQNMNTAVSKQIPVTLDSDAKDEYIVFVLNDYLITYNTKQSTILKDRTSGYEYATFVKDNTIIPIRVQTDLKEKDFIPLVTDHKLYKLCIDNEVVKIVDTNIILPEKENFNISMTNQAGDKNYTIAMVNGEMVIVNS